MTELAWPLVTLAAIALVVWRVDAFARRWGISQTLGKRVSALEEAVSHKAQLDEVATLRDKLHHLTLRVGQPR